MSNLDAKLRIRMREEIKKIQKTLNITTIYVTHDQEEAMSISDRVAVMNQGRILQVGTPQDIYFRPKNVFVATFIGKSTLLQGKVVKRDADMVVVDVGGEARITGRLGSDSRIKEGMTRCSSLSPRTSQ